MALLRPKSRTLCNAGDTAAGLEVACRDVGSCHRSVWCDSDDDNGGASTKKQGKPATLKRWARRTRTRQRKRGKASESDDAGTATAPTVSLTVWLLVVVACCGCLYPFSFSFSFTGATTAYTISFWRSNNMRRTACELVRTLEWSAYCGSAPRTPCRSSYRHTRSRSSSP